MATAAEKLIKARAGLLMDSPFFGALAIKLKFLEDNSMSSGWTDGRTLGYNSEWIDTLTAAQIKGFIAHEVYHNALGHTFRRQQRDPSGWNKACDIVLNGRLKAAGFELPDNGLFDDSKKDMAPEEVYSQLPPEDKDGSGSNDPGMCGACKDGNNEQENKQLEHEWKQNVAEAAMIARAAGKLPSDIEKMIDKLFEPQIDWREVLAMKIDPNGKDDYSWTRRNRRFQHIYLPAIRSERVGDVVIIMDTSGSMWSGDDLVYAKTELKAIFDMVKPTNIHVLHVDSHLHKHDHYTADDFDINFKPRGGGGTDFSPGFDYLDTTDIQPEIVIYFTDMYGEFPKHDHGFDVMWIDTCSQWQGTVPFGQHFKLRLEK